MSDHRLKDSLRWSIIERIYHQHGYSRGQCKILWFLRTGKHLPNYLHLCPPEQLVHLVALIMQEKERDT